MKAYINNIDWADEGDVFFFSVESEENLQALKELIEIYIKLDLFHEKVQMYWGTNEWFYFSGENLLEFINQAEDISDEELEVFYKFKISGFDIYKRILISLENYIIPVWYYYANKSTFPDISEEELYKMESLPIKLFGLERWNWIIAKFNKQHDTKRNRYIN